MKCLALSLVLLFILAVPCPAARKPYVVFEATVTRIEPWGPIRTSCGIVANFRLAEYTVDRAYEGTVSIGQQLVVEHIACDYNELNDLNVGEEVLVVAEVLEKPETRTWKREPMSKAAPQTFVIAYRGLSIGKIVYSSR